MSGDLETETLRAWIDGGARGNPGPAGWGVLLEDPEGRPVRRCWGFLDTATNNVAEYNGLILALEHALALGARGLTVHTDSELMQRQLTGVYKVRQPHLRELFTEARSLIARLDAFDIKHVRREENREADRLANRAMDERGSGVEEGDPDD
jgi:ribonuclease HI